MDIATVTRAACCRPLEVHVVASVITTDKTVLAHDARRVQLAIAAAVRDLIGRKDGATHAFALVPRQLGQDLRRRQRLVFPTGAQRRQQRVARGQDGGAGAASQRQVALQREAHERQELLLAVPRDRLLGYGSRHARRVGVFRGRRLDLGC